MPCEPSGTENVRPPACAARGLARSLQRRARRTDLDPATQRDGGVATVGRRIFDFSFLSLGYRYNAYAHVEFTNRLLDGSAGSGAVLGAPGRRPYTEGTVGIAPGATYGSSIATPFTVSGPPATHASMTARPRLE